MKALTATIRIGLPLVGGALPAAARELGCATLVSANALARYRGEGQGRTFTSFRQAPDLDGLDVALDSAGFVAWARYGAFPWTAVAYVGLAASRPWAWWAQMDACCEEEIARNRGTVRLRQAETIRLLIECQAAARARGIAPPVPVLQGRTPADYVWHARQLWLGDDALIGVGSMCRRPVHGPEGLVAVVEALDRELPPDCRLHLFGVKSAGLAALGAHPRVASIDSMAWDTNARFDNKFASRTMEVRAEAMREWYAQQMLASGTRPTPQVNLFGAGAPLGVDQPHAEWGDLLAASECSMREAAYFAAWEACWGPEPQEGEA